MAAVEDSDSSGSAASEEAAPAEADGDLEDEFDLADLMAEETGSAAKSNADRLAEVDAQIQVLIPGCTLRSQPPHVCTGGITVCRRCITFRSTPRQSCGGRHVYMRVIRGATHAA